MNENNNNMEINENKIALYEKALAECNMSKCDCGGSEFIYDLDLNMSPLMKVGYGMRRRSKPILNRTCKLCNKTMQFDAITLVGKENAI